MNKCHFCGTDHNFVAVLSSFNHPSFYICKNCDEVLANAKAIATPALMPTPSRRNPIRDTLHGYHDDHDRLWLIHIPGKHTYAITEYNSEITGYSPELNDAHSEFHYSGNAYYIIYTLAPSLGWVVEEANDRPHDNNKEKK